VVDMVWSAGYDGTQEDFLSNFTPNDKGQSELTIDDLALIPMFSLPATTQ